MFCAGENIYGHLVKAVLFVNDLLSLGPAHAPQGGVFSSCMKLLSLLAHFYGQWYMLAKLLTVVTLFQKCAGLKHLNFSWNT